MATAGRVTTALLTLLMLPAQLVEEGLHAVAALHFADDVSVSIDPTSGKAETIVRYREGVPQWAVTLAHVAPQLAASAAGLAVIAWWALGNAVWWPSTTLDWLLLWFVGVQYLAIGMPEQGDPPEAGDVS